MSKIENISNMIKQESSTKNTLTLCKTLGVTMGALLLVRLDSVKNVVAVVEEVVKYPFTLMHNTAVTFQNVLYIPAWLTFLLIGSGVVVAISNVKSAGKKK